MEVEVAQPYHMLVGRAKQAWPVTAFVWADKAWARRLRAHTSQAIMPTHRRWNETMADARETF